MRLFAAALALMATTVTAEEVTTYKLDNGMDIVVIEDHRVVQTPWFGDMDVPLPACVHIVRQPRGRCRPLGAVLRDVELSAASRLEFVLLRPLADAALGWVGLDRPTALQHCETACQCRW